MIAGGTSTCATSSAKFSIPSRCACWTAIAFAGAVVSNPTAKNTTVRSGLRRATSSASSGEYTTRTSPPAARAMNRSSDEPGTRSMSPNEQTIASGRFAIAMASSINATGVTHTGQPGPCTSSISGGEHLVDPLPDQRVRLAAADLHDRPRAASWPRGSAPRSESATRSSRYSSRYFIRTPPVGRRRDPAAGRCSRGCPSRRAARRSARPPPRRPR